jgi:hypothetical protein
VENWIVPFENFMFLEIGDEVSDDSRRKLEYAEQRFML